MSKTRFALDARPSLRVRTAFLPYALPTVGAEEIAEVVDTLQSGWVTTGPKVKRFESMFADYVQCANAISTNSCTAGLHTALTALHVGPGDEVVLPTLTFCATANVVVHLGATPVLVDVGDDLNVMPEAIEAAITHRTKAIVPVHFGGQACDLEAILTIAERHQLPVVADAAHAVGATYRGRPIGCDLDSNGRVGSRLISVFSFYATKNMTTGEGGMIATADHDLAARMRILALHGMSHDAWRRYAKGGSWSYDVVLPGFKYNMTDIQAALGIHQLCKLNDFIAVRQRYARLYDEAFADLPEVATPITHADRSHCYHLYVIRLELSRLSIDRAQFIEELTLRNVGASVHFIPVHLHPFYRDRFGYRRGDIAGAERAYDRIVSLPLYPRMTQRDVQYVADVVHDIVTLHRR